MVTTAPASARARRRAPGTGTTGAPSRRTVVSRRSAVKVALLGAAAAAASAGCAPQDPPAASGAGSSPPTRRPGASPSATTASPGSARGARVLVAYCSRAGENYWYGDRRDLEVGNTEVLATMISELLPDCDVHRIEALEAYPEEYDATVARNVREQDGDARPAIADALEDLSRYDTVLLGSPIWNVRPPMIMNTFVEGHDLTGTRVLPFVTYAVSGLGSTARVYAEACPGADVEEGLAVRGEEVRDARPVVAAWLREAGLTTT